MSIIPLYFPITNFDFNLSIIPPYFSTPNFAIICTLIYDCSLTIHCRSPILLLSYYYPIFVPIYLITLLYFYILNFCPNLSIILPYFPITNFNFNLSIIPPYFSTPNFTIIICTLIYNCSLFETFIIILSQIFIHIYLLCTLTFLSQSIYYPPYFSIPNFRPDLSINSLNYLPSISPLCAH